jgi:hypothetical protein
MIARLAEKTNTRLFFLDLSESRVVSVNPDGSDLKTILDVGKRLPRGIVGDVDLDL